MIEDGTRGSGQQIPRASALTGPGQPLVELLDEGGEALAVGPELVAVGPGACFAEVHAVPEGDAPAGRGRYQPQQSVLKPHAGHRQTACIRNISTPHRSQSTFSASGRGTGAGLDEGPGAGESGIRQLEQPSAA
jgi:hypothetical protein